MGRLHRSTLASAFLVAGIFAILLTGCGGGGGSATRAGSSGAGGTGTVAVLVSDGPEDLERLFIYVTEVALIPANSGRPVIVFQDRDGCKIDLLAYQDNEAFILKLADVPAGYYEKVRLRISDVYAEGGSSPCSGEFEIKLPSGKIDLVDRGGGGFYVRTGKVLAISLDVDVPKSINLHPAGNSDKCIFRPVVFVDIEELRAPGRCPYFVSGTITRILHDEGDIAGFVLANARGDFKVVLSEATSFFDPYGASTDATIIATGKTAGVFGRLLPNGRIQALAVAVGDVRLARGVVQRAVDGGQFAIKPPNGEDILIGVADSEVYIGCSDDDKVDTQAIRPGLLAKVMGVFPPNDAILEDDQEFTAVVVFLKKEIQGHLTNVEINGPTSLEIEYAPGQFTEVSLPQGTEVYLEGDGAIPLDDLQGRVTCSELENPKVRVLLPFDRYDPEATTEVLVRPDRISGTVVHIRPLTRTLWVRDTNGTEWEVNVRAGAFMLLDVGGYDMPISFSNIQPYDSLTVFGLRVCPDRVDCNFDAYMVLAE